MIHRDFMGFFVGEMVILIYVHGDFMEFSGEL